MQGAVVFCEDGDLSKNRFMNHAVTRVRETFQPSRVMNAAFCLGMPRPARSWQLCVLVFVMSPRGGHANYDRHCETLIRSATCYEDGIVSSLREERTSLCSKQHTDSNLII